MERILFCDDDEITRELLAMKCNEVLVGKVRGIKIVEKASRILEEISTTPYAAVFIDLSQDDDTYEVADRIL